MKLTLLVLATAILIGVLAFQAPSLFFIGYLWASILSPGYFIIWPVPLPFIFGCFSLLGLFIAKRSLPAPFPLVFYLAIALAIWVTLTTFWAILPDQAWTKWNWAIESILLVIATPIFLRTRAQIEAGFACAFAAIAAHVMTAGIKTVFGTGGYDQLGRLMMTNFWLGETSTLALAAVISLSMVSYVVYRSTILSHLRGIWATVGMWIYVFIAIMCVVGTSARTGLVALIAFLVIGLRKIWLQALVILLAVGVYFGATTLLPQKTEGRFSTLRTYQSDDSAEIRLAVWRWGIEFAKEHPFGGGFNAFYTSDITYKVTDANGEIVYRHTGATAPHSVYFEVLGEHGYPGLLLYLSLLISGLIGTWRIGRNRLLGADLEWCRWFGRCLFVCLVLFAVGSGFIGIAFQPLLFIFLGLYCAVFRLLRGEARQQWKLQSAHVEPRLAGHA
jgi:probable O-glycosylation ligase (exosortase A-associated)